MCGSNGAHTQDRKPELADERIQSCAQTMLRIPLIEDLTNGPIPVGSQLMVEFDPSTQWYSASLTIAAGWLKSGGRVNYNTLAQPPNEVRMKLGRLGLDVAQLEGQDFLRIVDWHTATLGQKSAEKFGRDSLKVHDASISFAKMWMHGPPEPDRLLIADNTSVFARFNEERTWVEYHLTRTIPVFKTRQVMAIRAVIRDLHSNWVYKQLESASDGVIDLRLEEVDQEPRDVMRIRVMKNVGFDRRWHQLKVNENFEVTLEK